MPLFPKVQIYFLFVIACAHSLCQASWQVNLRVHLLADRVGDDLEHCASYLPQVRHQLLLLTLHSVAERPAGVPSLFRHSTKPAYGSHPPAPMLLELSRVFCHSCVLRSGFKSVCVCVCVCGRGRGGVWCVCVCSVCVCVGGVMWRVCVCVPRLIPRPYPLTFGLRCPDPRRPDSGMLGPRQILLTKLLNGFPWVDRGPFWAL